MTIIKDPVIESWTVARITVFRDGLTYYEVIWKFSEAFSYFAVLYCFTLRCLHENNITRGLSYHLYWRQRYRIYLCTPNIRFPDVKANKQQYYPSSIGQQDFDIVNKFKVHSTYVCITCRVTATYKWGHFSGPTNCCRFVGTAIRTNAECGWKYIKFGNHRENVYHIHRVSGPCTKINISEDVVRKSIIARGPSGSIFIFST